MRCRWTTLNERSTRTYRMQNYKIISFFIRTVMIITLLSQKVFAISDKTMLEVWANEAIIATYTYNADNFLKQQKTIAKYFTANAWTAYSKALHDSGLAEKIEKNRWNVSAVATMPPVITSINPTNWKVEMPILVIYKTKDVTQKQNLNVSLTFTEAPKEQGIRGLAITSMNTSVIQPPCECQSDAVAPQSGVPIVDSAKKGSIEPN